VINSVGTLSNAPDSSITIPTVMSLSALSCADCAVKSISVPLAALPTQLLVRGFQDLSSRHSTGILCFIAFTSCNLIRDDVLEITPYCVGSENVSKSTLH